MPLLKKQPFVREPNPPGIDDASEVFYCSATGEIFDDYESFFERVVLCNSLQWSCSVTGRPNLTFEEAYSCEKKATAYANSLPGFLKKIYVYLMSLTHRTILAEANDEVFGFMKQRYFIGETVEYASKSDRRTCVVADVELLKTADDGDGDSEEGSKAKVVDPSSYIYTLKESKENGSILSARHDKISRMKSSVTREKGRLFLKLNSESIHGLWVLKSSVISKYGLTSFDFGSCFPGLPPSFAPMTEKETAVVERKKALAAKKLQQQLKEERARQPVAPVKKLLRPLAVKEGTEVALAAAAADKVSKVAMTAERKEAQREELKKERQAKREELLKRTMEDRAKKREEKEKEKEKIREDRRLEMEKLFEWNRRREDLECDDLKPLPSSQQIYTHTPNCLFGEMVSILEFMAVFKDLIDPEERFPHGITLDILDRALTETDINGPLCDILALLLSAIFSLQDVEDEETSAEVMTMENSPRATPMLPSANDTMDEEEVVSDLSYHQLIKSATLASQTPLLCHGAHMKEFPLDPLTVSEVLRLHILGSGAEASPLCIKFRYQQRGGYNPRDDAGLELRRRSPAVVRSLGTGNVFDLSPECKLEVLNCLTQQLMSYAAVRDHVDESFESLKAARAELRQHQVSLYKKEKEDVILRSKRKAVARIKEMEKNQKKMERLNELVAAGKSPAEASAEVEKLEEAEVDSDEVKEEKAQARKAINRLLGDTVKLDPSPAPLNEYMTRRKGDDQVDISEFDDIDWDSVDDSLLTDEEKVLIASRRKEYDVRKRQYNLDTERILKDAIQRLQLQSSVYPLGKDRYHRTYWVFSSLPGIFVEQTPTLQSIGEEPSELKPTATEPAAPLINGSSSPRNTDSDAVAASTSPVVPMNGVCEEPEATKKPEVAEQSESKPSPGLCNGVNDNRVVGGDTVDESGRVGPVDHVEKVSNGVHNGLPDKVSVGNEVSVSVRRLVLDVEKCDQTKSSEGMDTAAVPAEPCSSSTTQWRVYTTTSEMTALIASLNRRGVRENTLKQALEEWQRLLEAALEEAEEFPTEPIECVEDQLASRAGPKVQQTSVISRNKVMQGLVKNQSALETMELNLREMLLDIEERVYAGALGAIKVKDRWSWREAIEQGSYRPQDADIAAKVAMVTAGVNGEVDSDELTSSQVVRDLSHALLQIEACIDRKYLSYPLGNSEMKDKRGKARSSSSKVSLAEGEGQVEPDDITVKILSRWREGLASATGISQVFLYLSTLEGSVTWSKSALNARCKLCRRKGDGEKMLLCDVCDRGHHMYCLKPAVKHVPSGNWYCPTCRPKKAPAPRKRAAARKSFQEEEEEEEDESEKEEEEEEAADSSSAEESEEGELTPPTNRKVRLLRAFGSGHASNQSSRASSPALSRGGSKRASRHVSPERSTSEVAVTTGGRKGRGSATTTPAQAEPVAVSNAGQKKKGRSRTRTEPEAAEVSAEVAVSQKRKRDRTESAPEMRKKKDTSKSKQKRADPTPERKKATSKSSRKRSKALDEDQGSDDEVAPKVSETKRKRSDAHSATAKRSSSSTSNLVNGKGSSPQRPARAMATDDMKDMAKVEEAVLLLDGRKDAWPFHFPVNRKEVPDYHRIIKKPMDLSTIKSKINMVHYPSAAEMVADVRLMFKNCEIYNVENSDIYRTGQRLGKLFENKIKSLKLD